MIAAQAVLNRPLIQSVPYSRLLACLIAAQAFCAYMTGMKFIATLAHNVGPFEVLAVALLCAVLLWFLKYDLPIKMHPILRILGLILIAAGISLVMIPSSRLFNGIIAVVILLFMLVTVFTLYNAVSLDERYLVWLLRSLAVSAAFASVWVLVAGTESTGVTTGGPYRNRAHASIISLTSFWFVLVYIFWPRVSKKEQLVLYFILPLLLYIVAIGGRRSVYASFTIGVAGLALACLFAYGRGKLKVLGAFLVIGVTFWLLYFVMSEFWAPATFFKQRAGMMPSRVQLFTGAYEEDFEAEGIADVDDNFFALQRRGAIRAFTENPILGIGWGGFLRSEYSPTGHEMHSTPFRFLAELGMVGITLYVALMGTLWWRSFKLWLLARGTPYQAVAMVVCIAICSLTISYVYNRQVTERTSYIMIAIFLCLESLVVKRTCLYLQRHGHSIAAA